MNKSNQNIIITGASYGIGYELAKLYASSGNSLFLLARSHDKLSEIQKELQYTKAIIYIQSCDVSNSGEMQQSIDLATEKLGSIDILILNAGIGVSTWMESFDRSQIDKIFNVNLFGVINGFESIIPIMKNQRHGKIVTISSLAETRGFPGSGAYCASKAAISIFCESARIELKQYGISVMTIKPGFIKTPMTAKHKYYMPMLMNADKAAEKIIRAISKNKSQYNFPKFMSLIVFLLRLVPNFIFDNVIRVGKKQISDIEI